MPDETQQKAKPVTPPDDGVRELRPVTIFNGQSTGVTKDFRPRQQDASEKPAPTKATVAPPAREEDQQPRLPAPPAKEGKGPAAEGDPEPPTPPVEPRREPPLIPDPNDDPSKDDPEDPSEDDGRPKGKKKK